MQLPVPKNWLPDTTAHPACVNALQVVPVQQAPRRHGFAEHDVLAPRNDEPLPAKEAHAAASVCSEQTPSCVQHEPTHRLGAQPVPVIQLPPTQFAWKAIAQLGPEQQLPSAGQAVAPHTELLPW